MTTANPEGAGNIIFGTAHGNTISVADTGGSTILTVALSVGSGTFTLSAYHTTSTNTVTGNTDDTLTHDDGSGRQCFGGEDGNL